MDNEPFPDELINEIAGAIKCTVAQKRAYLARELRSMVGFARLQRSGQSLGSLTARNKKLEIIEKAAILLLESIGLEDGNVDQETLDKMIRGNPTLSLFAYHVAAQIDPNKPEDVIRLGMDTDWILMTVIAVTRLREAAAAARSELQRDIRPGRGGARRKTDKALHEVVWHLLRLYWEVTERKPGVSKDSESAEAGGPAVRFVQLCLPPLGWHGKTVDAVVGLIREAKEDPDQPWTSDMAKPTRKLD